MKKILGIVAGLLILLVAGLVVWLYPREDVPRPPVAVDVEAFEEIPAAFVHRWTNEQTFPFLGAALIDTDGDGATEVFVGGAEGQPDVLLRYENGALVDRIDGTGLSDTTATYGATSIDLDADGYLDLLVAQNYIKLPMFKLRRVPGKAMLQVARPENAAGFYHLDEWGLNNAYFAQAPLIANFDGDARPDVLWLNMDGPARAFLNKTEADFVSVALPDDVATLGARVQVETPEGRRYTKQAVASVGLMTDQSPTLFFGLGATQGPATITLEHPDGSVTVTDSVAINQTIRF